MLNLAIQIQIQIQTLTLTLLTPPEDLKENRVRDAPTTHRFIKPSPKTPHALVSPEHSSKVSLPLFVLLFISLMNLENLYIGKSRKCVKWNFVGQSF